MVMKPNIDDFLQRRESILPQMHAIDRLRRGTLSRQFFQSPSGKRGPYYVLQGFFHGKKFSERIPEHQAGQVQQEVANYRRFQALAEEYVTLSDQIGRLQQEEQPSKKNSRRRKSRTSSSRKPPPS